MRVQQSRYARSLHSEINGFETRKQDTRPSVTQEYITSDDANNASCRNAMLVSPHARKGPPTIPRRHGARRAQ